MSRRLDRSGTLARQETFSFPGIGMVIKRGTAPLLSATALATVGSHPGSIPTICAISSTRPGTAILVRIPATIVIIVIIVIVAATALTTIGLHPGFIPTVCAISSLRPGTAVLVRIPTTPLVLTLVVTLAASRFAELVVGSIPSRRLDISRPAAHVTCDDVVPERPDSFSVIVSKSLRLLHHRVGLVPYHASAIAIRIGEPHGMAEFMGHDILSAVIIVIQIDFPVPVCAVRPPIEHGYCIGIFSAAKAYVNSVSGPCGIT